VNDIGLFPVALVDPEVVMGEGNGTSQRQPSDDDGKDVAFMKFFLSSAAGLRRATDGTVRNGRWSMADAFRKEQGAPCARRAASTERPKRRAGAGFAGLDRLV
jgi:hypothetical protein